MSIFDEGTRVEIASGRDADSLNLNILLHLEQDLFEILY